jgi:hypothetical protein
LHEGDLAGEIVALLPAGNPAVAEGGTRAASAQKGVNVIPALSALCPYVLDPSSIRPFPKRVLVNAKPFARYA